MKCPNCEKEMNEIVHKDYCIAAWDCFSPHYYYTTYYCKYCHIRFDGKKWYIPKKYEGPTERQIRAIYFINKWLCRSYEPILKNQCSRIIKANLSQAANIKNLNNFLDIEE